MLGANLSSQECGFKVWAPNARRVQLRWTSRGEARLSHLSHISHPSQLSDLSHISQLERSDDGHFFTKVRAAAGDRYFYQVDDHKPVPDPVSRFLPEGVHGPTEIVDPQAFVWNDAGWRGLPLKDYVLYELHPGTFHPNGSPARNSFDAVVERLGHLKDLGITVLELMPVAAFPGTRNWGYDGVSLYAVQASYGGPDGLKRLVDAAHRAGLGVVLDVVYNHLGNEGNYLRWFGPYFTEKHKTPWGDAINYDQEGCQGVRQYFVQNALYWIREYHLDGLRLDAVQTIQDTSAKHILAEIGESVTNVAQALGRQVCVIAETDENDTKVVRPRSQGGFGLDALWSDDFHHAVHAFFTGERQGYYQDFGAPEQIAQALNQGFVFQGEASRFWNGRTRGTSADGMWLPQHVICLQNHDQVGNRAQGERLTQLLPEGARMAAAALLLLAPQTPLIFMGEEYGEPSPFLFFTDYGDPELQKAVREGRKKEFKDFGFDHIPDPQDEETFQRSRLHWPAPTNATLDWYRTLLHIRRQYVIDSERTCKASLDNEGAILTLRTPAENARLQVAVTLKPGAVLSSVSVAPVSQVSLRQASLTQAEGPQGWEVIASTERDGYCVRVSALAKQ
ncbi:MAG TPA: malto-oligosyltrehalose trehalohydrolase [Candidatus Angelobacter sp.]|nr:malto-oligosyltrehalose trehalohydrolase [Candidatus Angelobacter sp.]